VPRWTQVYQPELGVNVSDTPRILSFKKAKSHDLTIKCRWWRVVYKTITTASLLQCLKTTIISQMVPLLAYLTEHILQSLCVCEMLSTVVRITWTACQPEMHFLQ